MPSTVFKSPLGRGVIPLWYGGVFRLFLFLLLFCAPLASLQAQDRGALTSGPLAPIHLRPDLVFSVIPKPGSKSLKWKIEKTGPGGPDSIMAGEILGPTEKYAYFWDAKTEILWFATQKTIMYIKLKDWSFTSSLYRPTSEFETDQDLPPGLKAMIPEVMKQK